MSNRIPNVSSTIEVCPKDFFPIKKSQGFILWYKKIVDIVEELNVELDKRFEELLTKQINVDDGSLYPALPEGDNDKNIEKYYALCANW